MEKRIKLLKWMCGDCKVKCVSSRDRTYALFTYAEMCVE